MTETHNSVVWHSLFPPKPGSVRTPHVSPQLDVSKNHLQHTACLTCGSRMLSGTSGAHIAIEHWFTASGWRSRKDESQCLIQRLCGSEKQRRSRSHRHTLVQLLYPCARPVSLDAASTWSAGLSSWQQLACWPAITWPYYLAIARLFARGQLVSASASQPAFRRRRPELLGVQYTCKGLAALKSAVCIGLLIDAQITESDIPSAVVVRSGMHS